MGSMEFVATFMIVLIMKLMPQILLKLCFFTDMGVWIALYKNND